MTNAASAEREARIAALTFETTMAAPRFFRGGGRSIVEIWQRRELLGLLVRREIRARYKDSSLGIVWSLIRPLAQLLIYYFAIGQVLGVAKGIPGFAIFVFVGLTTWTFFTEIVNAGTTSIVSNAGLIKKVYLPREIFPLAAVGGGLFTLAIQFVVLIAGTIAFLQFPWSPNLIYLLPSLAVILVWASGFAILLGAINVYFRDVQHLVEVALIIFFWASPIVYSYKYVAALAGTGWLSQVYLANPITVSVLGMQKAIWIAGASDPHNFPGDLVLRLAVTLVVGVVFLWVSQRVFARLQGNFAQEL